MRKTIRRSGGTLGLPLGDALLDGDRARHRIDHRAELDDRAVAHELDDPAVALGEQRIDHLAAQIPDRGQRAGLVLLRSGASSRRCRRP